MAYLQAVPDIMRCQCHNDEAASARDGLPHPRQRPHPRQIARHVKTQVYTWYTTHVFMLSTSACDATLRTLSASALPRGATAEETFFSTSARYTNACSGVSQGGRTEVKGHVTYKRPRHTRALLVVK